MFGGVFCRDQSKYNKSYEQVQQKFSLSSVGIKCRQGLILTLLIYHYVGVFLSFPVFFGAPVDTFDNTCIGGDCS
jgi:hypothetical protein